MSPENVTVEPQPSRMSEPGRLAGIFFEPKKAFEDIAVRPNFWAPLILTVLVGLIFTFLLSTRLGWDEINRQKMMFTPKMAQQMEQAPPEQREMQRRIAPVSSYGGALLGPPIGYLIVAAVLFGIVRGIMSAPLNFKLVYAVVCYAMLPNILQNILKMVVLYLKKPEEFFLLNPLTFNPGALMDFQSSSKFVYALATALDVFTIWVIVLIAVGLSTAGGKKLSFGSALAAVVIPWLILTFIGAGIASMFG